MAAATGPTTPIDVATAVPASTWPQHAWRARWGKTLAERVRVERDALGLVRMRVEVDRGKR